jgi:hypothetical protein
MSPAPRTRRKRKYLPVEARSKDYSLGALL